MPPNDLNVPLPPLPTLQASNSQVQYQVPAQQEDHLQNIHLPSTSEAAADFLFDFEQQHQPTPTIVAAPSASDSSVAPMLIDDQMGQEAMAQLLNQHADAVF